MVDAPTKAGRIFTGKVRLVLHQARLSQVPVDTDNHVQCDAGHGRWIATVTVTILRVQLMSEIVSQLTAPNLRIEAANGVSYAYRRFGNSTGKALPLVCLIHYRGNLDSWDPILVDTIASQHRNPGRGPRPFVSPGMWRSRPVVPSMEKFFRLEA